MANLFKVVVVIFLLLYPVLIYFGLNYFSPTQMGVFFLVLFVVRGIFAKTKSKAARWQLIFTVTIGVILAALTSIYNSAEFLKWYPVGLNIAFFIIFTNSVIYPPSVIESIARLVPNKDFPPSAVIYTRRVTMVWAAFFVLNGIISAWTVLYASMEVWTLYNGLISYIAVGALLGGEVLVRKIVKPR